MKIQQHKMYQIILYIRLPKDTIIYTTTQFAQAGKFCTVAIIIVNSLRFHSFSTHDLTFNSRIPRNSLLYFYKTENGLRK